MVEVCYCRGGTFWPNELFVTDEAPPLGTEGSNHTNTHANTPEYRVFVSYN